MKPSLLFSAMLVIAMLSLGACNKPAQQGFQMPTPEVTAMTAKSQTVPLQRQLVGRLASIRSAQVRARVAGILLKRVYTEGTDVEKGQVLFQIDPAPLKAALHAEEAALAKAKADQMNAALIAKRYRGLDKKKLISSQDLDTALANERTTAAAVKMAEANVEKAQLDLSYATVTAPIAGRAGLAQVTEGALVGQDEATVLTTVEQIDPMYVNFSQSATELQELQGISPMDPDMTSRVAVLMQDGTPYPHDGKLDFSNLAVNPGTGTVSLRAVVPNPDHRLLPGMFVNLKLTIGEIGHAFLIPQNAVMRDGQGAFVYIVDSDGKVEQRMIKTHGLTSENWIVTGSINDGDHVVIEGLQKIRPGAMAKVTITDQPDAGSGNHGSVATKAESQG